MAKTIEDLAVKLRAAFDSDDQFERLLQEPHTQKLSKANVVSLFKSVFGTERPLGKSLTKPDMFNAIRRERISRMRARW